MYFTDTPFFNRIEAIMKQLPRYFVDIITRS